MTKYCIKKKYIYIFYVFKSSPPTDIIHEEKSFNSSDITMKIIKKYFQNENSTILILHLKFLIYPVVDFLFYMRENI